MGDANNVQADTARSAERRAELDRYMTDFVGNTSAGLVCRHADRCASSAAAEGLEFYGGQLGHVGEAFDLRIRDRALRFLVVGQEFGRKPDSIPIAGRATGAHDLVTVLERRADVVTFRGTQTFNERNAHMRGTSLA